MTKPTPKQYPLPRRHSTGCWLVAATSLLIAFFLSALSLILPPINLPDRLIAAQYSPLEAASPAIALDAKFRLSLPPDAIADDYAVKIERLLTDEIESANGAGASWLAIALGDLPDFLTLSSPLYVIESRGRPPASLQIELMPPAESPPTNRLSLYGLDGERWRFIPSAFAAGALQGKADFAPRALAAFQISEAPPIVLISQEVSQDLDAEIAALATILSPAGLRPTLEGGLIGGLAPGGDVDGPYLFMPSIRNFTDPRAIDVNTIETLISRPRLRQQHIARISDLASYNRFDGVFIDYRGISPQHRGDFARFVSELAASLSERDLRLGLVVAPERDADGAWRSAAYDWRRIGEAADYLQLRALINPLSFILDETGEVGDLLRAVTGAVARNKVLLGLSARSIREVGDLQIRIGWHDAFAPVGDVILSADAASETGSIEPGAVIRASLSGYKAWTGIQQNIQTAYIDYQDESAAAISRVWLTDAAALRQRLRNVTSHAIAGAAFDDLLAAGHSPNLPAAILNFKQGGSGGAQPAQLQARWSIEGETGALDQVVSNLDADLALTLDAPEGNYAINWAVIDDTAVQSARRGAVIPLFRPTPTPTPTPIPTPTRVPRPVVVLAPPTEASTPAAPRLAAVAPPPGSISIELGGHVHEPNAGRTISAMRQAGMTWMKIQSRFYHHSHPEIGGTIASAHSNGFKILVGTVGNPEELAQGGQGYIDAYTDWLARVAAQGADAIEVWNEPNLDREWPRGQISGVDYAQMLRLAYQKIKRANGNTMVISAAPAPTGAQVPGRVMPDNTWMRQMVEGGGLDYLDCVGVHYNEGIVPPDQTSGDPRGDNYYTRYFYGMLNGYISITRRPICFTELGYLTSDGLPALPPFFSWARDVTVHQQSAWLAQAAALASQSGQVRLLIVWNVDFTHYGTDPQAGFAIIRPDGSCPACQALASAR
ncbi:MAG: hypothetical protein OXI77_16890 [Chloroflexota bacterium]|nr:hypothetical protein [Chloroflexota bacterium]MDE2908185.1 hypothetical protein [Chloroflexota bacterium]